MEAKEGRELTCHWWAPSPTSLALGDRWRKARDVGCSLPQHCRRSWWLYSERFHLLFLSHYLVSGRLSSKMEDISVAVVPIFKQGNARQGFLNQKMPPALCLLLLCSLPFSLLFHTLHRCHLGQHAGLWCDFLAYRLLHQPNAPARSLAVTPVKTTHCASHCLFCFIILKLQMVLQPIYHATKHLRRTVDIRVILPQRQSANTECT